jgi:hypothetical protein
MSVARSVCIEALDVAVSVAALEAPPRAPGRAPPRAPRGADEREDAMLAARVKSTADAIAARLERFESANRALLSSCSAAQSATLFCCVSLSFARESVAKLPADPELLRRAMAEIAKECGSDAVRAELDADAIDGPHVALAHFMDHLRAFALARMEGRGQ